MPTSKSVIINCAGIGSRLGFGKTKTLIEICNKPLIGWLLEMTKSIKDVRVVVGFQAENVIHTALSYRQDLTFIHNHNYATTGTGHSLSLAAKVSNPYVLSLDGDLVVHPDSLSKILNLPGEFVCYDTPKTQEPIYLDLFEKENQILWARSFSKQNKTPYEWTGIVQLKTENIGAIDGYVFELVTQHLPLKAIKVIGHDIDTQKDYEAAQQWYSTLKEGL